MKKRLEADLVSIAHRILQQNKSDVNQLFLETQNYMRNYLFDSLMSIMVLPSLQPTLKLKSKTLW
jgi:Trm5-related predicted tRNA methylase